MARYLVTGGCGFIGSHLVACLLQRGDEIVVVDNLSTGRRENVPPDVKLIIADISDTDAYADELNDIDGCFHLAAIASVERSHIAWRETHQINLSAFVGLMEAIANSTRPDNHVVYASSAAVYGDNPEAPLTESSSPMPISAYGADKLSCELHARVGDIGHGLKTTGLRFFNVFGPRQDPESPYSGVISIFAGRALDRRDIVIDGDGEQSRDFIYVADVASALVAAMLRTGAGAEVINVCRGRAVTINQLADTISQIIMHDVPITRGPPRSGDIRHSLGDPSKLIRLLGINTEHDLESGLRLTLDWMVEERETAPCHEQD